MTKRNQTKLNDAARANLQGVELVGPWLKNNGDGLNLWSVVEWSRGRTRVGVSSMLGVERLPSEADLSWVKWPTSAGSMIGAAARGEVGVAARQLKETAALAALSESKLAAHSLMDGRRMAGLLDCSGFAYGDVWSLPRVERRIQAYGRVKRHGGKLIMLPQAFGPFTKPDVRDRVGTLLGMCDLIFARDRVSLDHLQTLPGLEGKLEIAPDVTHLLTGREPDDSIAWGQRVLIVPNARMLDRTDAAVAERYEAFVGRAVEATRGAGLEPWLMVHETNDRGLAERLATRLGGGGALPIIEEAALESKGRIAGSFAVIGSRYHSLISALSSGVPAVGTSWHHKYEELFDDYGRGDYLISPADSDQRQAEVLRQLLDRENRDAAAARVAERAAEQKALVSAAWARVDACLGIGGAATR